MPNIKEIAKNVVERATQPAGPKQIVEEGIQQFKATIADCENGIILLEAGIFAGNMAERIVRHREWLVTQRMGLQRQLFKLQDEKPEAS